MILWAHIDENGIIISTGTAHGLDVFLQPIADGHQLVRRPEYVTGFGNWKFVDNEWVEIP